MNFHFEWCTRFLVPKHSPNHPSTIGYEEAREKYIYNFQLSLNYLSQIVLRYFPRTILMQKNQELKNSDITGLKVQDHKNRRKSQKLLFNDYV